MVLFFFLRISIVLKVKMVEPKVQEKKRKYKCRELTKLYFFRLCFQQFVNVLFSSSCDLFSWSVSQSFRDSHQWMALMLKELL